MQWGVLKAGETADRDLIVLDQQGFDTLVNNALDQLRWIKEAVEQLKYYRGETNGNDTTTPPTSGQGG